MKTISRYIMTLALLLTAATGAWAQDTYTVQFKANGNTKTVENITLPHTFGCSYNDETGFGTGELDVIIQELYGLSGGICASIVPESDNASVTCDVDNGDNQYIIVNAPFNGTATVTGVYFYSNYDSFNYSLEITCVAPTDEPAEPTVTINDDKTEASFLMPTSDVTVNYELVRDMSVKVSAEVGDGSNGYRIRIKKDGNDFVPVNDKEMLISVSDDLDEQHPIDLTVNTDFTLLVQKKGEGDTWTDLSNDDKLSVGTFRYKVTGAGNYDGTIYSNEFQLFQGYEVVIPAGEYVTYYMEDEPLYADPETSTDAELYTITSVSGDKAILSNAIETAPSGTPLLVYNNGTEEKTFLLIPANAEPNLALDVYDGFIGTMQPTVIPASNATTDNYAFNGKQFVWVMGAIGIGANKAYLSIPKTNGNPKNIRLHRGNGETTGIDASLVNSEEVNSVWYDLNGRKLQGKPSLKGVYIKNGKKVVVK